MQQNRLTERSVPHDSFAQSTSRDKSSSSLITTIFYRSVNEKNYLVQRVRLICLTWIWIASSLSSLFSWSWSSSPSAYILSYFLAGRWSLSKLRSLNTPRRLTSPFGWPVAPFTMVSHTAHV